MQTALLSEENKLVRLIVEPRYRWLRHTLLVCLLVVTYNSTMITYIGSLREMGNQVAYLTVLQFILYLGVIYLNIYVLVPQLFLRSRYALYCLALLGMLTAVFLGNYLMEYFVHRAYSLEPGLYSYINPDHYVAIDFLSDILVAGMCCVGTTLTILFRHWLTDGKRKAELETREYRARIGQFKDSVSSAFLSDTLQKAADEATEDSDLTVSLIARLSRFLRYRLYDSSREMVLLRSEAVFLDNYLSLVRDIRPGFGYSISDRTAAGNIPVRSSVLINLTDLILHAMPPHRPGSLDITLCSGNGSVTINFCTTCEAVRLSACAIAAGAEAILTATLSSHHPVRLDTDDHWFDMTVEFQPMERAV